MTAQKADKTNQLNVIVVWCGKVGSVFALDFAFE